MCESKKPEVLPLCRVSPSRKLTAIVQLCNRNLLGQRLLWTSGRYPGVTPMFIPGSLEGFFLCCWLKLSQWFYLGRQRFCIPSQMFLLFKNEVDMGIRLQLHVLLSNAEPTNRILCKVGPVPLVTDFFTKMQGTTGLPFLQRSDCSDSTVFTLGMKNSLVHKYYIPLGKIMNFCVVAF